MVQDSKLRSNVVLFVFSRRRAMSEPMLSFEKDKVQLVSNYDVSMKEVCSVQMYTINQKNLLDQIIYKFYAMGFVQQGHELCPGQRQLDQ